MIPLGAILVLAASVLHCWYSGHATAPQYNQAFGFVRYGRVVLVVSVVLLLAGLALVWVGGSLVASLVAAAVYFLVLPLLMMALLQQLELIPERETDQIDTGFKECPICHLANPPGATRCDCGFALPVLNQEKTFAEECAECGAGIMKPKYTRTHISTGHREWVCDDCYHRINPLDVRLRLMVVRILPWVGLVGIVYLVRACT